LLFETFKEIKLFYDEPLLCLISFVTIRLKEDIMAQPDDMYQCQTVNCGYIYDPDRGDRKGKIPKGTKFEDISDEWRCPVCGSTKKMFKPLAGPGSVQEENK
jgi:rubredoxin